MKWRREATSDYRARDASGKWRVWRDGARWRGGHEEQAAFDFFRTKHEAQKHCEKRAGLKPVQRWLNGEPVEQLPRGSRERVLAHVARLEAVAKAARDVAPTKPWFGHPADCSCPFHTLAAALAAVDGEDT